LPISGATVLRVMRDVHDFGCTNVVLDRGLTDQEGWISLPGKRKWRMVIPAPGGLPVPNHQIAIWKQGYLAFVFSQYGNIDELTRACRREDLLAALDEVPAERRVHTPADEPDKLFLDGKVTLEREQGSVDGPTSAGRERR
jgi:hypothetical protein